MANSKHYGLAVGRNLNPIHISKACELDTYDISFSENEVLLNESLVRDWNLSNGALLRLSTSDAQLRRNSTLSIKGKARTENNAKLNEVTLVFRYEETPPEVLSKFPNLQVAVLRNIATALNLAKHSLVTVSRVDEDDVLASHVEITFRDAYLTRADMWRMVCTELAGKPIYKGQKIVFLQSIRAQIKSIYRHGTKLTSGVFGPSTKPIFRSESARFVIFLQMSKEMWDFEPEGNGEIMFSKVIDGFLPELFRRWSNLPGSQTSARHLISIVLFTRMEYQMPDSSTDKSSGNERSAGRPHCDFYRVLTANMESGRHETVLLRLKKDFKTFLRDVSIRPASSTRTSGGLQDGFFRHGDVPIDSIQGHPAPAVRGNILEAINTATSQFSEDYIDRDLLRTGLSIVVVTPGTGVFEVDAGLLNLTTDILVENGVGIDLVCLARMPLHSVPLFKYKKESHNTQSLHLSDNEVDKQAGDMKDSSTKSRSSLPPAQKTGTVGSDTPGETRDVWSYAIPHWLDTSFWMGKSALAAHKTSGIRSFLPSSAKPFPMRVKMYEIQMMGIMENETSSVSIPYLEAYRDSSTAQDLVASIDALRNQASNSNLRNLPATKLDAYGASSASFSPRSPAHINSAKALSGLISWMNDHDEQIFKTDEAVSAKKKDTERSQKGARDTGYRIQSAANPLQRAHTSSALSRKSSFPPAKSTQTPSIIVPRKVSNASIARPALNLLGSIKGSKSAFKGFGSFLTKAVASVELSSENAHRESILTHDTGSLSRPTTSAYSDSSSVSIVEDHASSEKSVEKKHPYSRPTSPPSKPIFIKQAGKDKQSLKEHDDSENEIESSLTPQLGLQLPHTEDVLSTNESDAKPVLLRALAPWFTLLNPCNPDFVNTDSLSSLGRWHHVFPRPLHASTMKWKSLCAPASIPLTSEAFPTAEQLAFEYDVTTWSVSAADSASGSGDQDNLTDVALFREMICGRFSNGYQFIIGEHIANVLGDPRLQTLDIFNNDHIFERCSPLYMSRGTQVHRLTLQSNSSIEVKQYIRNKSYGIAEEAEKRSHLLYTPYIKTPISSAYEQRNIKFSTSREAYNWKRFDNFLAGTEQEQDLDVLTELKYWRARYVLLPVPLSSNLKKTSPALPEDNDEEIRLEGIYKLTQMWQKNRFMPVKELRQRVVTGVSTDINPLDIIFRTKSPSIVVASELHDLLLENTSGSTHPRNLLPESELLTRSAVDLKTLAQLLQSDKGVKMQDRWWHLRLHPFCFLAIEFITWLVDNFRDIDDRDTAVEFGLQLMKEGLFSHVEKRHPFRDGNFFFQINSEYRLPRVDKGTSWFNRLASVPSTPIVESRQGSKLQIQTIGEDQSSEGTSKTSTDNSNLTQVILSKKLMYDVDKKSKSYRREVINLHYDRISSADDCYHVRISWLNVTPKLIEDAVSSWAVAVERFGLRLVEIPITEAFRVNEIHTFRSPYIIKLAKQPPDNHIPSSNTTGAATSTLIGRFPYHKALLKRFTFILDLEAVDDFPSTVSVSYSWGRPDYQCPQFISRDGLLLAQITRDGNLLLLGNRLSNNRRGTYGSTSGKPVQSGAMSGNMPIFPTAQAPAKIPPLRVSTPGQSPFTSPMVLATSEANFSLDTKIDTDTSLPLKDRLEAFCQDAKLLEDFFEAVRTNSGASTGPSTPRIGAIIEGKISLPPVPPLRDIGLGAGRREVPGL